MRVLSAKKFKQGAQKSAALVVLASLSACSATPQVEVYGTTSTVVLRETVNELEKEPVPGTVNEVWVEPMYDTIEVPGQLHNYSYRLPHRAVVEIPHGKVQKVEYPDGNEQYLQPR